MTSPEGDIGLDAVAAVPVFALAHEQEHQRHERDTGEAQQRGPDGGGERSFADDEQHCPRDERKEADARSEDIGLRDSWHVVGMLPVRGGLIRPRLGHIQARAARNQQRIRSASEPAPPNDGLEPML
jgi:hypothetical protein